MKKPILAKDSVTVNMIMVVIKINKIVDPIWYHKTIQEIHNPLMVVRT